MRLAQVLAAEQVSKKRERGLFSHQSKSVCMMGGDRRTHSEWVGLFLPQRTGKLNPVFCNFLSHITWAVTEVNLGTVCPPAKRLRRRHYQEMLSSTTIVLAWSSDPSDF